ncbi:MAG: hypothetical protein H6672_12185 [Anaerolineaceae bacterium]|nr:hypothetical protein [Anaerolineaceae bacterium]
MFNETDSNNPGWLEEFEQLANDQLGQGSSCPQVHPVIERWLNKLLDSDPPESRDSVAQAMACLSTEILYNAPPELVDTLLKTVTEDDLALWIEHVLLVGRAFEISLHNGELDDL